ncbi:MAG: hypothetical protein IPJ19_01120 [Planctomycetes bacterium]|nr:hypothetical protein [Planctomycetota bacterium]
MMKLILALVFTPVLLLPCAAGTAIAQDSATSVAASAQPAGWVVDRADNICGLDDAKMLSKPAKVDYDVLLKATAQYKKIKDNKIDPNSPEGIQLRQEAANKVRDACDKIRQQDGYCSVWKSIKHSDGRAVADITDLVKAQL